MSENEPSGGTLWVPAALIYDGVELQSSPEYEELVANARALDMNVELYDGSGGDAAIVAVILVVSLVGAFVGAAIVAILWWLVG